MGEVRNESNITCERLKSVQDFTIAFKHPMLDAPCKTIMFSWVKKRIEFIQSELDELEDAAEKNDIAECLDALLDIDYFLMGTILGLGLQEEYQEGFNIVHSANMAKLCSSEGEVQATISMYSYQSIDTTFAEVLPGKWAVYNAQTGKVMKSINYKAPNLSQLFNSEKV